MSGVLQQNGTSTASGGGPRDHDVIIIGTGFAGLGSAIKLRDEGFKDFVVLEKAYEVGGTWRENTYPGCACDVVSTVYSFSFAPKPDWTHTFARQPEILDYLRDIVTDYNLLPSIRFGTEVTEAAWDDAAQLWRVQTSAGEYTGRVVIAGTGPLHRPSLPDIPGIEEFKGKIFHSAEWDHDHDLTGESVAVVGTGASAIQFVPEIQPKVGKLTLFQRTAPWVLSKPDRKVSAAEKRLFKSVPLAQKALRGTLFSVLELIGVAERHAKAMNQLQTLVAGHLRKQVPDESIREKLEPHFTLGCKRILLSNTWYPAITADNAEIVHSGLERVTADGVIGADGVEHKVDTIIFGTGFHATDPPIASRVRGRDGKSLAELWGGSPQGYLGTVVSGFPNLFLMIGPNLGNGHNSAVVLIEDQLRYILGALKSMRSEGLASVDVSLETQDRFNDAVQKALKNTVWNAGGCQSYYIDRNGRNSSIYPWSTVDLWRRTRNFDLGDFETREADRQPVAA